MRGVWIRVKVTFLGTTTLLFDDGEDQILFDCHVTRPSIPRFLFGKIRTDRATADRVIRQFRITRLRAVFVSHSHYDHVLDVPYTVRVCGGEIYGSKSTLNAARGEGIPEEKLHLFDAGERYSVGKYRITVLKSLHSKPGFFNNDLGQTIDAPLSQPAKAKQYKEGGSYDFLVEHGEKKYLIRPSYNFIPGQLDGIRADVLFLAIAGLSKDDEAHKRQFWIETVDKVRPSLVIPLHWDHLFKPLYGPVLGQPKKFEFTGQSMFELAEACAERDICCVVQLPLTSIEI